LPPRFTAFSSEASTNGVDTDANRNSVEGNDDDDDDDDFGESTELRGTIFWAPPRPQLILKIHKKPRSLFKISNRFVELKIDLSSNLWSLLKNILLF
jgi:hypothetical protein